MLSKVPVHLLVLDPHIDRGLPIAHSPYYSPKIDYSPFHIIAEAPGPSFLLSVKSVDPYLDPQYNNIVVKR